MCATWLLARPGQASRRSIALAGLGALLLVLPWYAWVPANLAQWRVTGGWLSLHPGVDIRRVVALLPWSNAWLRSWPGIVDVFDWLNVGLFTLAFVLAVLRSGPRLVAGPRLLPFACFAVALLTPVTLDAVAGTYMVANIRYALAALPAFCVAAGSMLATLRLPLRTLLLAAIVLVALRGHREQLWGSRHGEPFNRIGQMVVTEASASDIVIVHSIPSGVCGVARAILRADPAATIPVSSWVGRLRPPFELAQLQDLARGRRRIMLVKIHAVGEASPHEAWLRVHARLISEKRLGSAEVLVFQPGRGETFFP